MKAVIPCAGKSSRFGGKPKFAMEIRGRKVLERSLEVLSKYCDEILIVSDSNNIAIARSIAESFPKSNVITDDSYSGNGGAIINAIDNEGIEDDIIIIWGDSYILDESIVKMMIQSSSLLPDSPLIIPCHREKSPYVSIITGKGDIASDVNLSRISGFREEEGWHDLSIFYLRKSAFSYLRKIPKRESEGKSFLDIIAILYEAGMPARILQMNDEKIVSFNSEEELAKARIKAGDY